MSDSFAATELLMMRGRQSDRLHNTYYNSIVPQW